MGKKSTKTIGEYIQEKQFSTFSEYLEELVKSYQMLNEATYFKWDGEKLEISRLTDGETSGAVDIDALASKDEGKKVLTAKTAEDVWKVIKAYAPTFALAKVNATKGKWTKIDLRDVGTTKKSSLT